MNPVVIIPTRLGSTRLPRKPLAEIAGRPMIAHVVERALEADLGPVWVAGEAEEIGAALEGCGAVYVLTRPDHPSGSDRIFEALGRLDPDGRHDVVVNVQGDLPTVAPASVRAALATLEEPAAQIGTIAAEIGTEHERTDPNVVKVIGSPLALRAAAGALLHPRHGPVGRRAALSPHRPLCLSPGRAGAFRVAAAESA